MSIKRRRCRCRSLWWRFSNFKLGRLNACYVNFKLISIAHTPPGTREDPSKPNRTHITDGIETERQTDRETDGQRDRETVLATEAGLRAVNTPIHRHNQSHIQSTHTHTLLCIHMPRGLLGHQFVVLTLLGHNKVERMKQKCDRQTSRMTHARCV